MVKRGKGMARKTATESDSDFPHLLASTGGDYSGTTRPHQPLEHNLHETRRYATRSTKSFLAQCTLRTSPRLSRNPVRNVKSIASPLSSTMTPPKTTPASHNLNSGVTPVPQVLMSAAASLSRSSNQVESSKSKDLLRTIINTEDLFKYVDNFLDTVEGSNPLIPLTTAPSHEVPPDLLLPLRDANMASVINDNQTEGSCANDNGQNNNRCLARSTSLNCTQIVEMVVDHNCEDEVDSTSVDPALVTVKGYRVKEEVAPLLRSILLKYGDIAKGCSLESKKFRSMLLEAVCGIYLQLVKRKPTDITSWEIKDILNQVADLEVLKVEVGWLRKKLEDIYEALEETKRYKAQQGEEASIISEKEMLVKELEESRNKTRLQEIEAEEARKKARVLESVVEESRKKNGVLEGELVNVEAKVLETKEAMAKSREKIKLLKRPLVDDLL